MKEFENVIVGAGLVGSLLALVLRQQGMSVALFEKRPDMRTSTVEAGRSINLVVTSRGIHALQQVGLDEQILAITTPVWGRMIHDVTGQCVYQSYSKDNTACNYSVSRAQLNQVLMTHAEQAGATLFFEHDLSDLNLEQSTLTFGSKTVRATRILATDGAGSRVRHCLAKQGWVTEHTDFLSHGYKELEIPPRPDGQPQLDKDALHIWPRGHQMMMALPNPDNSFTVTLYLPHNGEISFSALRTPDAVLSYFRTYYADAIPLMPQLIDDFFRNPTGILGTVWTDPWYYRDQVLLLGDAAHGVVPFFGQGMNAGFEDCMVLQQLIVSQGWYPGCFADYHEHQKPNGDAIARMALANFVEMREHVGDAKFLLEKQVEALLGRTFPTQYTSKYSMVTQTLIPYCVAEQAGEIQKDILQELCRGIQQAEDVDMQVAQTLIAQKLTPFLEQSSVRAAK